MKILLLSAALLVSALTLFSCQKDNPLPPEDQPQINLTLEDTSCTEAWIKLTTSNISLPAEIMLKQEDVITQTISLGNSDTLLYIDSLLPGHSYKFQSVIQSANRSSNSLEITTMDTTSHNFTWQTWTFGGTAGSSTLYDVAIIDQNDIWAVGEIYLADSSQNGYTLYNAVHWDGSQWELKRIQTIFRGNQITVPLTGIFTFSSTDIWLVGSLPIHGDGQNWVMYDVRTTVDPSLSLVKAWGKSTNDMYFVGNSGSIAHYQNGQWKKIESETDANITDIFGVFSGRTNKRKIFCSVPSGTEPFKRRILTINEENDVDSIPCNGNIVTSVWSTAEGIIYTSGWGIYSNKSGDLKKEVSVPDYYSNKVRGNGLNDIFVCGNYGFLAHYNGIGWEMYSEFTQLNLTLLASISIKDDLVVIVGFSGEAALVILGERN